MGEALESGAIVGPAEEIARSGPIHRIMDTKRLGRCPVPSLPENTAERSEFVRPSVGATVRALAMKGGATLATTLPTTPIFLTSGSSFNDYRPTMDPSGTTVIFERTPTRDDGGPTTLQMMDVSNPNPSPFLSGSAPASQTRPDWCWATGKSNVLFNGASSNNSKKSPVSVYMVGVVGSTGANPTLISGTTGAYYPKWNLEGTLFVTENTAARPPPAIRSSPSAASRRPPISTASMRTTCRSSAACPP